MRLLVDFSPTGATALGLHEHDHLLDDVSPEALADGRSRREQLRTALADLDLTTLPATTSLDVRTALIALDQRILSDSMVRPHQRAAYWYTQSLGNAVAALASGTHAPPEQRAADLSARLGAVRGFLQQAQENLDQDLPALWLEMGVAGASGLAELIAGAPEQFDGTIPTSLAATLDSASRDAAASVQEYGTWLGSRPPSDASWACGRDYFDGLLEQVQLIDLTSQELYEYGVECVDRDRTAIATFASSIDPDVPWDEQIDRIKDNCPPLDGFIEAYERHMHLAHEQTIAHDLITIPDDEECRMGWVPAYRRFELPIAVMDLSAPFAEGMTTQWSITPPDLSSSPEQLLQHRRDNCYAFAESIASHETYPGHHLQRVHHKLATANSRVRRAFMSPQFIEGWGLYVEDLWEQEGFFDDPSIRMFKLRNGLWRSLRIVIDVGIHTGRLSFDEAVELLRTEARMDLHMARGEVRRYARHDNPTYPSSYVLGRDRFHDLRARWTASNPHATLREFHDTVLSYGSVPLALVDESMMATQP